MAGCATFNSKKEGDISLFSHKEKTLILIIMTIIKNNNKKCVFSDRSCQAKVLV